MVRPLPHQQGLLTCFGSFGVFFQDLGTQHAWYNAIVTQGLSYVQLRSLCMML